MPIFGDRPPVSNTSIYSRNAFVDVCPLGPWAKRVKLPKRSSVKYALAAFKYSDVGSLPATCSKWWSCVLPWPRVNAEKVARTCLRYENMLKCHSWRCCRFIFVARMWWRWHFWASAGRARTALLTLIFHLDRVSFLPLGLGFCLVRMLTLTLSMIGWFLCNDVFVSRDMVIPCSCPACFHGLFWSVIGFFVPLQFLVLLNVGLPSFSSFWSLWGPC